MLSLIWWFREKIGEAFLWLRENEGNLIGSLFLSFFVMLWLNYEMDKGCVPYADLGETLAGELWPVILRMLNTFIEIAHQDIISAIIIFYFGLFFVGHTIDLFFFWARIIAWPVLVLLTPLKWLAKASLRIALFKAEELAGRFIDLSGYWSPHRFIQKQIPIEWRDKTWV